jgi:probable phosphomutase (TIGR03848 family)
MATVVLVRHGRSTANVARTLAGRQPGVGLDPYGVEQVAATGERLAAVPLARIVASPLERTVATAEAIAARQPSGEVVLEDGLLECDYGDWSGRAITELLREPLWRTVQATPSAVTFPGGEAMAAMSARVVAAVRAHDREVTERHGQNAVWAAVSHGDLIKSVLADALGLPFDRFQRLHVDPASVSIIRYDGDTSAVLASNTQAGDLSWLVQSPPTAEPVVGGGAGPGADPDAGPARGSH